MKQLSKTKEKDMIGLYNGHNIIIKSYETYYAIIGEEAIFLKHNYLLSVDNSLIKNENNKLFIYHNGDFIPMSFLNIDDSIYVRDYNQFLTYTSSEEGIKVLYNEGGNESVFEINERYLRCKDIVSDITIWGTSTDVKSLLFYSKTGLRLWEYKEEDDNLKINGRCIPIVDDVVVGDKPRSHCCNETSRI